MNKKICAIEGCNKKHYALNLCRMHYARQKRNGDLLTFFQKSNQNKIGNRFGNLVIIGLEDHHNAICKCDCGNIRYIPLGDLKLGKRVSCGCIYRSKIMRKLNREKAKNVSFKCNRYYEDYINGLSYSEIGKKYNVSKQAVGASLKKAFIII